jgi:hypothetical protein
VRSPNRRHDRQYFYKYTTADAAMIVLATRKFRWSSRLEFNDPFDVTQELSAKEGSIGEATQQSSRISRAPTFLFKD